MKRKMIKKLISVVMCGVFCSIIAFPNIVNANEVSEFQIYAETQAAIDEAIAAQKVNPDYINGVIELFNKEVHTDSDELNDFLVQSLKMALVVNEKTEKQMSDVVAEQKILQNQSNNEDAKSLRAGIHETAYLAGVNMVQNRGCPQTAAYMLHALYGNAATVYHRGDAWAKSCFLNQQFDSEIYPRFAKEILETGKPYGVISGSFEFGSPGGKNFITLDHYTALHYVNYSVSFTKNSVGYTAVYNMSDVYDFDWSAYDNFEVGFGNNYCYAMQQLGLIKPFKISIVYSM